MSSESPSLPPSVAHVERRLRAQLADMRQKISAPARALVGYGLEIQRHASESGLVTLLPDIARVMNAARGFHDNMTELLDPNRAIELRAIADEIEARAILRHDLCNPLTVVKGYAELLLEDAEANKADALAADIRKIIAAAESLASELDVIIDFSGTRALDGLAPVVSDAAAVAKRILSEIRPLDPVEQPAERAGKILVVDDIDVNRDLLARQLVRSGHDAMTADSGRSALKIMHEQEIDLVLLDLMMPELSGFEILQRMKASDRLRDIPVLIVSALEEHDSAIRCIEAGADDYLTKPINPVLLRARIQAGLERSRIRHLEAEHRRKLEAEKKKYEMLLLNILPRPIIDRLASGETIADEFDDATVLFSDFVGFTRLSRRMPSERVVSTLNRVFSEFDELAVTLGVEKIKTIGDGYLAVAGVPVPRSDHAPMIAEMALGMVDILDRINPSLDQPLQMRVGLASGPVTAGIIGAHKFAYDIWGNTVNMAARHESYSEPNRIHVACETVDLLSAYRLQSRGVLSIRGRGEVESYFLLGRK